MTEKIFLNKTREGWVVDRFRSEWYSNNSDISTRFITQADIIWIIAPWTWREINKKYLLNKKTVCTIHHIDMDKFDEKSKEDFYERDEYVDIYHAISNKTSQQIKELTDKPIVTMPFWVNDKIWFQIKEKDTLKRKYKLNNDTYLIGSFQRDTEGFDLKTPKLSKGPDQFIEILKHYKTIQEDIHVVLTGKRRDYVISKLKENNINFSYFEMVSFEKLNELYNCLDLYIVSSRVEGGPQSLLECGITKTPIISTDVGLASDILPEESLFNMSNFKKAKPMIEIAYSNSLKYKTPEGFNEFRKFFNN
tara:strand:- start:75 stop:992 length:918 start_codon:yes stop_codon:yes gene_type:complete